MTKRYFCTIFLSLLSTFTFAQTVIKGKVTDAATGIELASVSIFINNSSIGTISNEHGEFTIVSPAVQRFEIIASYVGYETKTTAISAANSSDIIAIHLEQRSAALTAVIIHSYETDGWKKWGKMFTEYLIGTNRAAAECKIKNPGVVGFVYDKKNDLLTAYASAPLQIENKYLGYGLVYDMQTFSYDQKKHLFFFSGYPFFKDMEGNGHKNKKWQQHRRYAYEGSIMHFMRSLYLNTLVKEGFTMNVLQRSANKEKQRIRKLYKESSYMSGDQMVIPYPDSASYFNRILGQSDSMDYVHKEPIISDSLAYGYDSTTVVFGYSDHLQITYGKNKEMPSPFPGQYTLDKPRSVLSMVGEPYILVYSDGSYFEPNNILTEGYWAWSEKLSGLLPINFKEAQ